MGSEEGGECGAISGRGGVVGAAGAHGGGGGGGARSGFQRKKTAGLTDRVGPPVSEREATAESDKRSRPVVKISKEMTWAIKVDRAKLTMGCGIFFSNFSNKDLGFKIKDFEFQTKIELGPN